MKKLLLSFYFVLAVCIVYGQSRANKSKDLVCKVKVYFEVDTTGSISNIKIHKKTKCNAKCTESFIDSLEKSAIESVVNMPKWKPTKRTVSFILPIAFILNDD
jgi:hypothetical protein